MEKFTRKKCSNRIKYAEVPYEIDSALGILYKHNNKKVQNTRKIPIKLIDDFLLSGKLNSVLGPNGFTLFKKYLKDITKKINDNDFSSNIINLDKMFEVLLDSGLYYVEEYLPDDFKNINNDIRWLTAYRYIAKNFPEIGYKDFRTIVKRFQETRGYSFYIKPDDSKLLQDMLKQEDLFIEIIDLKAVLMQLKQSELKAICNKLGIQSARSLKDTAERILTADEKDIEPLIPNENKSRVNLIIKDKELATGEDIMNLDRYLRELSKIMRSDFVDYILSKRYISFLKD